MSQKSHFSKNQTKKTNRIKTPDIVLDLSKKTNCKTEILSIIYWHIQMDNHSVRDESLSNLSKKKDTFRLSDYQQVT